MAQGGDACICGLHTAAASSSALHLKQQQEISCNIPERKAGVFAVENLDTSLTNSDSEEPCLQHALNAASYWLETNSAFQGELAKLVVDYSGADLPEIAFLTYFAENHTLLRPRLQAFLLTRALPTIRLESDLMTKFDRDVDIYGVFNPDECDFIYINSALIKKAKASPESSLSISFLIFVKVIHELCHWITHFTMKGEQKIRTPTGFFNVESGEFMEMAMFGGIVSHHSKSGCPWEIELVLSNKVAGREEADYFNVNYMKSFFDRESVDKCDQLHALRAGPYTIHIQDKMLATVTRISTNDELGKPAKGKYNGHVTRISLAGVGGQNFIPGRDVLVRK